MLEPSLQGVSFQEASRVSFSYSGEMYHYQDSRINQCSTPDHKMYAQKCYDGPWQAMTVEEILHEKLMKLLACVTLSVWMYTSIQVTPSCSYSCSKQLRMSTFGFSQNPLAPRYSMMRL